MTLLSIPIAFPELARKYSPSQHSYLRRILDLSQTASNRSKFNIMLTFLIPFIKTCIFASPLSSVVKPRSLTNLSVPQFLMSHNTMSSISFAARSKAHPVFRAKASCTVR